MRKLIAIFSLLLVFSGCALFESHSDEYISSVKEAVKVAEALDATVTKMAANDVKLVAEDTQRLVDAGKMTPEVRNIVIQAAADQATNAKRMAIFIREFLEVALKEATGEALTLDEFFDLLHKANEAIPELQKFIEQLQMLVKGNDDH